VNAQPARQQVVIASDGGAPNDAVLARLRAELTREGYEVVDEALPAPERVAATVRFERRDPELKLEVTVRPAARSEIARRSFHGDLTESRTVVLRVVEYILASQLDQLPAGAAAALPPAAPPRAHPPAKSVDAVARFHPELGAVAFLGVPGADPALGATMAFGYSIAPRYRLRLRGAATARNGTQTPRGSARFSHGLATLGGAWDQPLGARLSLELSASAGAYVLTAAGESTSDLQPQSTFTLVAAGALGLGTRVRPALAVPLGVYVRGEALFSSRRPTVRFGTETIERMSQPSVLASAGMDFAF
jgi:hypothetical protein